MFASFVYNVHVCFGILVLSIECHVMYKRLNNSEPSNRYAYYTDLSSALTWSPIWNKTFECYSMTQCGIYCAFEMPCNAFQMNLADNSCTIARVDGIDSRSDGAYTCPNEYTLYNAGSKAYCWLMTDEWASRDISQSKCADKNGTFVILIDKEKHDAAVKIAMDLYSSKSTGFWIDAMLNTTHNKWYWSDGTQVDEDRFRQNGDFIDRLATKPCVAFLIDKYSVYDCNSAKFALCEVPLERG